ncbi:unnamed protein product, partial [Didymodactylos carnosus]
DKALPRSPLKILLFDARFNRIELFTDLFRFGLKQISTSGKQQYESILYIYGRSYRAIGKTKQDIRQTLSQHITATTITIPTGSTNTVIMKEDAKTKTTKRKKNRKQKQKCDIKEIKFGRNGPLTLPLPFPSIPLKHKQINLTSMENNSPQWNNFHSTNSSSLMFRPQLYSQKQPLLLQSQHYYYASNQYPSTSTASADFMSPHLEQHTHLCPISYRQQHSSHYQMTNYDTPLMGLTNPTILSYSSPSNSTLYQSTNDNSTIKWPLNYYQQSHCSQFEQMNWTPTTSTIIQQEPVLPQVDNDEVEFFRLQWKIEDHLIRAGATLDVKKRYRSNSISSNSSNSSSRWSQSFYHHNSTSYQHFRHNLRTASRSREQSSNRRSYSRELSVGLKSPTSSRTRNFDSNKRRQYSDPRKRESVTTTTTAKYSQHCPNTLSITEPTSDKSLSPKMRVHELIDVLASLIEQNPSATNNKQTAGL